MKPPTCAENATPEPASENLISRNCCTNHNGSTTNAGRKKRKFICGRSQNGMNRNSIFDLKKRTRYAPMTAAIAPDAPTSGTMLFGCCAQYVSVAAKPPVKYNAEKSGRPKTSSTN